MRAGFIEAPLKAYFRDDMPEPMIGSADQVKIRVRKCGICGSEVHAYHGKHPFRIPPVVSGHEFSGDVVEVGSAVTKYKVGDRVTAEPQYGCGKCVYCRQGRYNLCTEKHVLGSNGWSGPFGEYVVVPEKTVVRLPDNLSYEEGALIEPVANAMYAVRNSVVPITEDTTICIIGAGPIGLGDLLCAQLYSPKLLVMVDISDYSLETARRMGCRHTINSRSEDLMEKAMELTDGVGFDMTFLAFGDEPTLQQAAEITKRGGIMQQHALMLDGVGFPYRVHQQHELTFAAYNMYRYDDFEAILAALSEGRMKLDGFVTQRYPIEKFHEALEMADKRPVPVVKVMLEY
jgi:L-iditol 2-dehydrogenase